MTTSSNHSLAPDSLAKKAVALRYWLLGRGYTSAALAMDFAASYHSGVRKDQITPEFSHQVAIASHLRTQAASLMHPQETITVSFCHDLREDYNVSDTEIRSMFGDRVANAVDALTKEYRGTRRDEIELFANMAHDPIASVVKPADRIHNHSTLLGVFSGDKIKEYVAETRSLVLPMLKAARRNFPSQEPVYEALGLVLSTQLPLLDFVALKSTPS